jgi:hypothetical protein
MLVRYIEVEMVPLSVQDKRMTLAPTVKRIPERPFSIIRYLPLELRIDASLFHLVAAELAGKRPAHFRHTDK